MIQNEGVDSLSEAELRQACRERGMLGLRSVEDMRKQVIFCQYQCIFEAYPSRFLVKLDTLHCGMCFFRLLY